MELSVSAPLLSRLKSWQLVGLGISGWVTLYSVAILTWGASSTIIGNTQGGCFATTMTLAGLEASRFRRGGSLPVDPLQWVHGIPTEHLNLTLTRAMEKQEYRIEPANKLDMELGFGVRGVKAGRTVVFETAHWKNPVIDLPHAQTTEDNRQRVRADLAFLVGAGTPNEETRAFVKKHPLQLLAERELKHLVAAELPPVPKLENVSAVPASNGVLPLDKSSS
jgi:hypothetical protein